MMIAWLVSLYLTLALATQGWAQSRVDLRPEQDEFAVAGKVDLWTEVPVPGQPELTLSQVQGQNFVPTSSGLLNFDYTNRIFWLRLTLRNPSEKPQDLVLEVPTSWLDRVSFYEPDAAGFREETMGDTLRSDRPKKYRYPTFFFQVPPQKTVAYFLRVSGEDALIIPLKLERPDAFHERSLNRAYGIGAYAGLILVLTLYNLIVYATLRDRNYLYYILYILGMGSVTLAFEGLGTQYLFYDNPPLANRMLALITFMPMFFSLVFVTGFLEVARYSRRLFLVMRAYLGFVLAMTLYSLVNPGYSSTIQLASFSSVFYPPVLAVVGILLLKKSSRAAKFFLLAWTPLLVSVGTYAMTIWGMLPANTLTVNVLYLGSSLESVLLSLALADRMKVLIRSQSQINVQLEAAQSVQKAYIFDQENIPGLRYSTFYKSADLTGGDWYGLFDDPKNERTYILIGDVTGHGIPSALVTGAVAGAAETAVRLISEESLPLVDSLRKIAEQLNRVVLKTGQASREMMTMAFVVIERETLKAAYLNCGHTQICITSGGKVNAVLEPGSMLGTAEFRPGAVELQFGPGDILFVFTDGLTENHGSRNKPLRWRQIQKILGQHSEPEKITDELVHLIQGVTAGESPQDDCTFLAVQIQPRTHADQAALSSADAG